MSFYTHIYCLILFEPEHFWTCCCPIIFISSCAYVRSMVWPTTVVERERLHNFLLVPMQHFAVPLSLCVVPVKSASIFRHFSLSRRDVLLFCLSWGNTQVYVRSHSCPVPDGIDYTQMQRELPLQRDRRKTFFF